MDGAGVPSPAGVAALESDAASVFGAAGEPFMSDESSGGAVLGDWLFTSPSGNRRRSVEGETLSVTMFLEGGAIGRRDSKVAFSRRAELEMREAGRAFSREGKARHGRGAWDAWENRSVVFPEVHARWAAQEE